MQKNPSSKDTGKKTWSTMPEPQSLEIGFVHSKSQWPNCRKENTNKLEHETEQKRNGQVHNRFKKTNHSECIELISKSERDTGSLNQYRNENCMDLWKNFKEPICPGDEI